MKEFLKQNKKLAYITYFIICTITLYFLISAISPLYFLSGTISPLYFLSGSDDTFGLIMFYYFLLTFILILSIPLINIIFKDINQTKIKKKLHLFSILTTFSIISLFHMVVFKDDFSKESIDKRYSYLNKEIIISNNNIEPKTKEYKEFRNYMAKSDKEKSTFYYTNISKLKNIGKDKTFELIMAMKSINDKNIQDKINSIYSDKFISEEEYSEFKSFILEQEIDSEYIAFLNLK